MRMHSLYSTGIKLFHTCMKSLNLHEDSYQNWGTRHLGNCLFVCTFWQYTVSQNIFSSGNTFIYHFFCDLTSIHLNEEVIVRITNSLTCDWPIGCCFDPFPNISLNEEQICWQPCFAGSSGKCIQLASLIVPDQTRLAHRIPPLLIIITIQITVCMKDNSLTWDWCKKTVTFQSINYAYQVCIYQGTSLPKGAGINNNEQYIYDEYLKDPIIIWTTTCKKDMKTFNWSLQSYIQLHDVFIMYIVSVYGCSKKGHSLNWQFSWTGGHSIILSNFIKNSTCWIFNIVSAALHA